jgi:asparagine synthetase B (glutamine-hydrolysing)
MPGIIAFAGVGDSRWDTLLGQFAAIWEPVELRSSPTCRIAAHSHRGGALQDDASGNWVGVDGEASIYRPRALDLDTRNNFAHLSHGFLELGPECRGNVITYYPGSATLCFSAEWTGTFPLYYVRLDDCLLLSSHLRPLARAGESQLDLPGILQFLRLSYNVHGRTFFKDVRRVLPGEAFWYDTTSGVLNKNDQSRLWTGHDLRGQPSAIGNC